MLPIQHHPHNKRKFEVQINFYYLFLTIDMKDSILYQYQEYTRNVCMQQTLAHPFNTSPQNPSKIDNFSKLSKREFIHTITGRMNAVDKEQSIKS